MWTDRGNNARAVVILQQEDGSYMAYRVIPTELTLDNDFAEAHPTRTRITLGGVLIDGRIWQPPPEFFADQGEVEGNRPALPQVG